MTITSYGYDSQLFSMPHKKDQITLEVSEIAQQERFGMPSLPLRSMLLTKAYAASMLINHICV